MKYFKVLASTLLFAVANLAYALPVLQLGIGGGVYDTSTETIVTTNPTFTLYAYGKATGGNAIDLTETHYISIAFGGQDIWEGRTWCTSWRDWFI